MVKKQRAVISRQLRRNEFVSFIMSDLPDAISYIEFAYIMGEGGKVLGPRLQGGRKNFNQYKLIIDV